MARKIRAREILRLLEAGMSRNAIARSQGVSKHSDLYSFFGHTRPREGVQDSGIREREAPMGQNPATEHADELGRETADYVISSGRPITERV